MKICKVIANVLPKIKGSVREYETPEGKIKEILLGRKWVPILEKLNSGEVIEYSYYWNGKLAYMDSSTNGIKYYDKKGKILYEKQPSGIEIAYEYSSKGELLEKRILHEKEGVFPT